jgi:serine phosphatase RsbU (regulator of sigma subunit)
MSNGLLSRLKQPGDLARLSTRIKRAVLILFFVVFFALSVVYHFLTWTTEPTPFLEVIYELVVLACYGTLWLLLANQLQQQRATPAKAFWHTLVFGVLLIGLSFALHLLIAGGFDAQSHRPLSLTTLVKINVLSLLEATFFFLLLLRFRDLVFFKRTKASERNWYLMLGFMVMASLVSLTRISGADDVWKDYLLALMIIPAVTFMVINSFRISWIVHLTFREKMAIIGLSTLMLGLLGFIGLTTNLDPEIGNNLMPGVSLYLDTYSPPLSQFMLLAGIFGFLYCMTALLSLLFHLPTTGDFQRRADEMAVMHSLTDLVNQVFNPEKLVSTITASPVEAGSADSAWLAVADPETGSLRPRIIATHNIAPALVAELVDIEAFYEEAVLSKKPVLLEQATADHRVQARPGDGLGSLLVMPLTARTETLGALFVAREVTHGFEKDDVEAISVFAAQAALALDNARLFEEQIERERLSREMAIAREVQHKLLPQHLPVLPGLTLAASSVSAQEVGGDYYDFVQLDDQRLAFIIGDVSGKGTSAAFYMAEMQGVFQSVSHIAPNPRDFLTHANRALASSLEKNVFISVIYGVLDLQREEVLLARAGHCPAATINLNGEARYLRSQGLGLGLDRGTLFQKTLAVEHIALQPGDVFVLYTDGLVESRSADGEEYGYDRLLDSVCAHRHEDAPDVHKLLLRDLDRFLGGLRQYDDDMTLVVLKWHGIDLSQTAPHKQENYAIRAVPLE